jgi:protein-arginine kinase
LNESFFFADNALGVAFNQSNTFVAKEILSKTFATRIEIELGKIHGIKSVQVNTLLYGIQKCLLLNLFLD